MTISNGKTGGVSYHYDDNWRGYVGPIRAMREQCLVEDILSRGQLRDWGCAAIKAAYRCWLRGVATVGQKKICQNKI